MPKQCLMFPTVFLWLSFDFTIIYMLSMEHFWGISLYNHMLSMEHLGKWVPMDFTYPCYTNSLYNHKKFQTSGDNDCRMPCRTKLKWKFFRGPVLSPSTVGGSWDPIPVSVQPRSPLDHFFMQAESFHLSKIDWPCWRVVGSCGHGWPMAIHVIQKEIIFWKRGIRKFDKNTIN